MLNSFPYNPYSEFGKPKKPELPADMHDYMVYMTREALKSMTSSLNGVCSGTESFLFQIRQMLAYDRSMRTLASWGIPGTTPWLSAMPQSWTGFGPQQVGFMPFWAQYNPAFQFAGNPAMSTLGNSFSPYAAGIPAYYSAMAIRPSIWGFSPTLPKFL